MIDLRSDTVTRPGPMMREAMMAAEVGDDVYGEDPTVTRLEAAVAGLTGKAAGLFVTSGTQGNLLALLSQCARGDEYVAGQEAHTYRLEGGGGAVLGGIQPQPIAFTERGELELASIRAAVKPDDFHFARTRLVCLENTYAGMVLHPEYLSAFGVCVRELGLRAHLDGARLMNASVACGLPAARLCEGFDTVSLCLSKSLGCPVGSVLAGDEATIAKARRWRKMLGGGMRQAGILAAAGLYALRHNVERLADDHARALRLGDALTTMGARLTGPVETNMVMLNLDDARLQTLKAHAAAAGIRISSPRLVTHLDIDDADISHVIDVFAEFGW